MKTKQQHLILLARLKTVLAAAFLMLFSGSVCAQNFLIDHTTTSTLSYELRAVSGSSSFDVYSGSSKVGNYTSLGPIKVTGGGTLNLVFNTSNPVVLYKATSTSGTPAYNTYSVLVTDGTLNMSLGSSYSSTTTLKRASDLLFQVFRVESTPDNQNSCQLNISGNASHRFVIDGMANMTVEGANDTSYVATNSGLEATGSLLSLSGNGGCATLTYVNLVNNWVTSGGSAIALGLSNTSAHFHLTMRHCLIDKCYTGGSGAGWNFSGNYNGTTASEITMEDCITQNCFSESTGSSDGGIFRTWSGPNCDITMTDCQILNNKSKKRSGGIMYNLAMSQPMELTRCTFDGNWTGENGGAIQLQAAATVTACTFTNNYAKINGGAICNRPYDGGSGNSPGYAPHNGSLILDANTIISNNEAQGNGGGIYVFVHPTMFLIGSSTTYPPYGINPDATWTVFKNNNGQQFAMNVELQGATISNNKAVNGGGIFLYRDCDIYQTNVLLNWGTVENNTATGYGGACYVYSEITTPLNYANKDEEGNPCPYTGEARNMVVALGNSSSSHTLSMKGNRAANGGAVYSTFDHDASVTSSTIKASLQQNAVVGTSDSPNIATAGNGGALYINKGYITLLGGNIQYNTATGAGGGIYPAADAIVQVGAGNFSVQHNTVNSVPNNVYLPTNKKIEVISNAFNPQYIGVYTQSTTPPIPVFEVSSSSNSAWLQRIYDGMVAGTMNVVDDKQLYTADYTSSQTILYFNNNPWSPMQRTTALSDLHQDANNVYEIGNVKELTAFLCHVNGITPNAVNFGSGDQTAKGKLTADIDMDGHYWVPIGTAYTGTFDGNGHTISNLTMVPSNTSTGRGMFGINTSGTIKNVILKDCYMAAGTGYVGSIVSQNSSGGTLCNSVAHGELVDSNGSAVIGGLVGNNSGTVHSCYAMPDITVGNTGNALGGLVGNNSGNLFNCFVNPKFITNIGSTGYKGGLVAVNNGVVENCYVRIRAGSVIPNTTFGLLVGQSNNANIKYCYTNIDPTIVGISYYATGTAPSGHGVFGLTSLPCLYNHADNQVTIASGANSYVPSGSNKQLLVTLNNWVSANKGNTPQTSYSYWLRPWQKDDVSKFINDDLPLLRLPATNAVASSSSDAYLNYNQVNDLLTAYATASDAVLLYGAESSMNSNSSSSATLYIDQEASLKQSSSKGAVNGYTSQVVGVYSSSRWHDFSSPLQQSFIGFNYASDGQPFSWDPNPCGVTFSSNNDQALFPSNTPDITRVDLYCFYEPEYHWLNLKRNTNSHWHMNAPEVQIIYNGNGIGASTNGNETYLVPGKGYLVSVDVDQLLQNYGTLNDGNVTLYSVTKTDENAWAERLGFNLLGNPYQSYLDFEAFVTRNGSSLWSGSGNYTATYAIFDSNLNSYVQYKNGVSYGSYGVARYIHPHQGFFIRKTATDNSTNTMVTYTNDMRVTDVTGVNFRGNEQPAYPLVNFIVRDSEGNGDVAVLELSRDNNEGAPKMRLGDCTGSISLSYEGEEYGILFRTELLDYQPLHFKASEEGIFTLEWNTANGEFSELTLIDNITGTTTDMLTRDSYSFEGNPDHYSARFKVVIGDYKDIEEHEDGPSTGSGTFAFIMGDNLVVNGEGIFSMYDVTGRMLMQQSIRGSQSTIALPSVSAGVYMLRLTNGNNGVKNQKIIIK